MYIVRAIGNFLLSELLWNITGGLYHIPINIFVMLFALRRAGRFDFARAAFVSFCANVFSLIAFNAFVIGVVVYTFGFEYSPPSSVEHPLVYPAFTIFSLGFVHAALQAFFFWATSGYFSLEVKRFSKLALVCNMVTSLLLYIFPFG